MSKHKATVTAEHIERGLAALGLGEGSRVMVHSSLSSFGHVAGGPDTVIQALIEIVTPAGTILMPSFNHGQPFKDDGPAVYDPLVTPTTNGAIPDRFWRLPNTYRSFNPTHPFAAWGTGAEELVATHHLGTTMGEGSPLHRLWKSGGSVLLLGVGFSSNTFHHAVESSVAAPCIGVRSEAYPVHMPDGSTQMLRTWGWRESSCPITDGDRYGSYLLESGAARTAAIGAATCTLVAMDRCAETVTSFLKNGLPPFPPCAQCPIRPRKVEWTVS